MYKRQGRRLSGSVTVQGAKNAVLPIMAASVLAPCETELLNVPSLRDVDATIPVSYTHLDVYKRQYEYSAPARPRPSLPKRRARRWVAPFLCVFGFTAAAALSVCALLARADLTVLRDECEQLEAQIEELANEHDHLVIDLSLIHISRRS